MPRTLCLSEIAESIFGRAGSWRRLAEANRLDDPLRLASGGWIEIPLGVGDTLGHSWFPQPYLGEPALRIVLDLDGDGVEDSLWFEPVLSQRHRPCKASIPLGDTTSPERLQEVTEATGPSDDAGRLFALGLTLLGPA